MLRFFGTSIFLTVASIIFAGVYIGPVAALTTATLMAIEIAFSFDNAVINAKVLARLSKLWQQLFLTLGMLIAIVGMRFVFPILIVMVTAGLPWQTVVDYALNQPKLYAENLEKAHLSIAAFGGAFLLVLSLYFLLDDKREALWLNRIERPLQKLGGQFWLPPLIAAAVILVLGSLSHEKTEVWRAGLAGVVSYALIHGMIESLGRLSGQKTDRHKGMYHGWSAFLAFMYLEVLDASFSFDGVLGAFAITDKILLIALGLGVGAYWVRSLTIYMVRKGTLNNYVYLEHGAHYAILTLAAALLTGIFYQIPDFITGTVGLAVIFASFQASRKFISLSRAAA